MAMIREIQVMGLVVERVLADSLYGEGSDLTRLLPQGAGNVPMTRFNFRQGSPTTPLLTGG